MLIHAAAGGVGQLLIQVCKISGAKVIGLVSSKDKKEMALSLRSDAAFLYDDDWKTRVLAMYPNGVDVVYDSIGTNMGTSIAVTKIFGQIVLFGLAGGKLELGDTLGIISYSKTITGGDLWNYLTSGEERIRRAGQFFEWIISGQIKVSPPTIFRLSEGKKAHDYMEERKSTGKVLMIP